MEKFKLMDKDNIIRLAVLLIVVFLIGINFISVPILIKWATILFLPLWAIFEICFFTLPFALLLLLVWLFAFAFSKLVFKLSKIDFFEKTKWLLATLCVIVVGAICDYNFTIILQNLSFFEISDYVWLFYYICMLCLTTSSVVLGNCRNVRYYYLLLLFPISWILMNIIFTPISEFIYS